MLKQVLGIACQLCGLCIAIYSFSDCKGNRQNYFIDSALTSGCVCPGDTLTYECTVEGSGFTIWTGTALDCPYHIALRHSQFSSTYGAFATCNNGAIVARSLSVEGNNYTSQLNVTLNSNTAGKTIMCFSDDGVRSTIHLSTVIPTPGLSPCMQCS